MIIEKKIPFRYPGGKFYALNSLAPFWSNCPHDEYREPFLGGGSVFFAKPKARFNILNDIDSELITTYKILQNPSLREQLIQMVKLEIATKDRWREIFEFIPQNDLEVAFKYYYLNRTSFSGKLSSPAWGYRDKRSLPPHRWDERIIPCGIKLEDSNIYNHDFEAIINMPRQGSKVLMFLDPPYFKPSKKKHYRNGFDMEDHLRLAECLKNTVHKFFLTYEDTPEIRELYSWAIINDMSFVYRVDNSNAQQGSRKMGLELVISNFELPQSNTIL